MPITHIVMFSISPSTSLPKVEEITTNFRSLHHRCLHPQTQQPYIQTLTGGANTSTEPFRAPYSHGFVLTFATKADLEYYLNEDPAHKAFGASVAGELGEGGVVGGVGVVDLE